MGPGRVVAKVMSRVGGAPSLLQERVLKSDLCIPKLTTV